MVPADRLMAMSIRWTRNRHGPSTVPCGTPEMTGSRSESLPSTPTACFRTEGSRKLLLLVWMLQKVGHQLHRLVIQLLLQAWLDGQQLHLLLLDIGEHLLEVAKV